jgi:hypothetical protein
LELFSFGFPHLTIGAKITNRNSFRQENLQSVGLLTIAMSSTAWPPDANFVCFLTKLRAERPQLNRPRTFVSITPSFGIGANNNFLFSPLQVASQQD